MKSELKTEERERRAAWRCVELAEITGKESEGQCDREREKRESEWGFSSLHSLDGDTVRGTGPGAEKSVRRPEKPRSFLIRKGNGGWTRNRRQATGAFALRASLQHRKRKRTCRQQEAEREEMFLRRVSKKEATMECNLSLKKAGKGEEEPSSEPSSLDCFKRRSAWRDRVVKAFRKTGSFVPLSQVFMQDRSPFLSVLRSPTRKTNHLLAIINLSSKHTIAGLFGSQFHFSSAFFRASLLSLTSLSANKSTEKRIRQGGNFFDSPATRPRRWEREAMRARKTPRVLALTRPSRRSPSRS
ncbi:hypothetical protein TGGT1_314800 [Toxoplasma gondii GT1]|uniref:Uncharacterized protein n=1 Tax=Toxoplasma gondii (strain ATCC 50853 / GT1) TaxID=507601 RepID=S7UMG8_TOXGG|nr:hypothetical protein TGGT1_314800 [Toxoplasma gondii GT1]